MIDYVIMLLVAVFAILVAGAALERRPIAIALAAAFILMLSAALLVYFFSKDGGPDAIMLLLGIFSIAAAEAIAIATFYIYAKASGSELEVMQT